MENIEETLDIELLGKAHDSVMNGSCLRGGLLGILRIVHTLKTEESQLTHNDARNAYYELLANSLLPKKEQIKKYTHVSVNIVPILKTYLESIGVFEREEVGVN